MGLKEMLDKQRQAKLQQQQPELKKALDTIAAPGFAETKPPTPAPAAGPLSRFKLPSRPSVPSQTVTTRRDANTVVQPSQQIGEKSSEKVTAPAPGPATETKIATNGTGSVGETRIPAGRISTIPAAVGANPIATPNPANLGLPSEPPPGLEELRKNIAFLSANIDQKELVGQVVRRVLIDLKKNPVFSTHMTDVDFNTITRAFRRSAVVAARKKTEARETKAKKRKDDNDFGDFMASSGMKNFDLG